MTKVSKYDVKWDRQLEELRLFAVANGGKANVPKGDPERPELGLWCMNQARSEPPPHDSCLRGCWCHLAF